MFDNRVGYLFAVPDEMWAYHELLKHVNTKGMVRVEGCYKGARENSFFVPVGSVTGNMKQLWNELNQEVVFFVRNGEVLPMEQKHGYYVDTMSRSIGRMTQLQNFTRTSDGKVWVVK